MATVTLPLWDFLMFARRNVGLTQAELAKMAGVSRNYISHIEHGDANVTVDTLERVANALGYNVTINLLPNEDPRHIREE